MKRSILFAALILVAGGCTALDTAMPQFAPVAAVPGVAATTTQPAIPGTPAQPRNWIGEGTTEIKLLASNPMVMALAATTPWGTYALYAIGGIATLLAGAAGHKALASPTVAKPTAVAGSATPAPAQTNQTPAISVNVGST